MKTLMITTAIAILGLTTVNSFAINKTILPATNVNATLANIEIENPFSVQEEVAQFPGDDVALQKFVQRNINYPAIAKAQGIEGKVIVSIVIDETGNLSNIEIVQSVGGGCDEEVIRILSEMPTWKPANQSGHAIKAKKLFSFNFQL